MPWSTVESNQSGLQPQVDRDGRKDLQPRLVELGIEPLENLAELGQLGRPDIGGHEFFQRIAARQGAPDVPEFLEIGGVVSHRLLGAIGRVTARAAGAFDEIGALGVFRQGEERAAQPLGLGDERVIDAVVGNDGKAEFGKAAAQLAGQRVQRLGQRYMGYVLGHGHVGHGAALTSAA